MKQLLVKIVSATVALLVLFSTFSFKVEKQFCGDFLVAVSYTGNLATCNDVEEDSCENAANEASCCGNAVEFVKGQDQIQKQSTEKITFNKVELGAVSYTVYELLFVTIEKQFNSLVFYTPPDFTVNLQVLYEVFII